MWGKVFWKRECVKNGANYKNWKENAVDAGEKKC